MAALASPEFVELRARLRRFVFPMTAFFLVWYATYVVLGAFAHAFRPTKVSGNVNVGLLIVISPAVSGAKTAMTPSMDFAYFPLANPGIVSIPLAFLLAVVGTLTGIGAEKAVTD